MRLRQSERGIDDLLEEWKADWLKNLELQVYELHHRRQIHDEFMAMLDSQDHPDTSIFQDAFHRMYIESQVMAIRRQADADSRTLSLRRLIGRLEHAGSGSRRVINGTPNPQVLTISPVDFVVTSDVVRQRGLG